MAVCVAVIGKDNGPLFFKCRGEKEETKGQQQQYPSTQGVLGTTPMTELQYSFIVSSALDIVEERVQLGSHQALKANPALGLGGSGGDTTPLATRELYLGALTAQEEYKVYGYMTNTKIKFIIIVEETSVPLRENDIRTMFRKLHGAFCDLMSNPFYMPGTAIHSRRFEGAVNSIIAGH